MQTLPGHRLGPPQPRGHIDPLRAMPLPLHEPPAAFARSILALVRGRIPALPRLVEHVSELHHPREPLGPSATPGGTMVHVDLEQTRLCLRLLRHGLPRGVDPIHDASTRLLGAATGKGQLAPRCIDESTRDRVLLASPIVSTGSIRATGAPATGARADLHRRLTSDTPSVDAGR